MDLTLTKARSNIRLPRAVFPKNVRSLSIVKNFGSGVRRNSFRDVIFFIRTAEVRRVLMLVGSVIPAPTKDSYRLEGGENGPSGELPIDSRG